MDFLRQNSATREDLGMLAVMEVLADQEQVTQRELARRTGLNLKKVHYCLHKLLEKGYVKFQRAVHNPDKRSYLYILTPAGLQAKSRLTYRFLRFTLEFYEQVEEKLIRCVQKMAAAGVRRVVLCGASEAARIVIGRVGEEAIEVVGVLDERIGQEMFEGVPVLRWEALSGQGWDGLLITALEDLDEVAASLRKKGIPEARIWHLS